MTPIQSIDIAALTATPQVAGPQTQVQVYDVARFQEAYANAGQPAAPAPTPAIEPMSPGFKVVLQNFESLNGKVGNLGDLASSIEAGGNTRVLQQHQRGQTHDLRRSLEQSQQQTRQADRLIAQRRAR